MSETDLGADLEPDIETRAARIAVHLSAHALVEKVATTKTTTLCCFEKPKQTFDIPVPFIENFSRLVRMGRASDDGHSILKSTKDMKERPITLEKAAEQAAEKTISFFQRKNTKQEHLKGLEEKEATYAVAVNVQEIGDKMMDVSIKPTVGGVSVEEKKKQQALLASVQSPELQAHNKWSEEKAAEKAVKAEAVALPPIPTAKAAALAPIPTAKAAALAPIPTAKAAAEAKVKIRHLKMFEDLKNLENKVNNPSKLDNIIVEQQKRAVRAAVHASVHVLVAAEAAEEAYQVNAATKAYHVMENDKTDRRKFNGCTTHRDAIENFLQAAIAGVAPAASAMATKILALRVLCEYYRSEPPMAEEAAAGPAASMAAMAARAAKEAEERVAAKEKAAAKEAKEAEEVVARAAYEAEKVAAEERVVRQARAVPWRVEAAVAKAAELAVAAKREAAAEKAAAEKAAAVKKQVPLFIVEAIKDANKEAKAATVAAEDTYNAFNVALRAATSAVNDPLSASSASKKAEDAAFDCAVKAEEAQFPAKTPNVNYKQQVHIMMDLVNSARMAPRQEVFDRWRDWDPGKEWIPSGLRLIAEVEKAEKMGEAIFNTLGTRLFEKMKMEDVMARRANLVEVSEVQSGMVNEKGVNNMATALFNLQLARSMRNIFIANNHDYINNVKITKGKDDKYYYDVIAENLEKHNDEYDVIAESLKKHNDNVKNHKEIFQKIKENMGTTVNGFKTIVEARGPQEGDGVSEKHTMSKGTITLEKLSRAPKLDGNSSDVGGSNKKRKRKRKTKRKKQNKRKTKRKKQNKRKTKRKRKSIKRR